MSLDKNPAMVANKNAEGDASEFIPNPPTVHRDNDANNPPMVHCDNDVNGTVGDPPAPFAAPVKGNRTRTDIADTTAATLVPPLVPIIPAMMQDDNSSMIDIAAALANYDGSLETVLDGNETTVPNVPEAVKGSRKGRMSFKDMGICASSSIYLKQGVDKNIAADHRTADSYLRGVITEHPNNKNNNSYQVQWDASSSSVPIDITDLWTSFFKDDNMYTIMKLETSTDQTWQRVWRASYVPLAHDKESDEEKESCQQRIGQSPQNNKT